MDTWNENIEQLLERIRANSIALSDKHRKVFYEYKGYSKYFDIPIIVVSVLSSSFSVGADLYISTQLTSTITCSISMLVTILTSVKLYLQLEETTKNELALSKSFYTLGIDVYKMLHLNRQDRSMNGLEYLNKKYNDYIKLIEQSALLKKNFKQDKLTELFDIQLSDTDSDYSNNKGVDI